MISSEISIALELHGISHVLSTGCTSSTDAIGYAASLIRAGEADVILVGRRRRVRHARDDLRLLEDARGARRSTTTRRPRRRGRSIAGATGFVLGEGAWMVVLEREDRARARGATIYATIDGYGSTCDAYHRVQMDPDGEQIVRAMRLAIERSGARHRGDRLRQLPRHVHGAERRRRVALRAPAVRRARRPGARVVDQVDDRPPAGGERRRRDRDQRAGAVARLPAADDQPARSRSRRATSTSSPTSGARASAAAALCNCLGLRIEEQRHRPGRGLTA